MNNNEIPDISTISDQAELDEILYGENNALKSTIEPIQMSESSPSPLPTDELNIQPDTEVVQNTKSQDSPITTPSSLSSSSPRFQPLLSVNPLSNAVFDTLLNQTPSSLNAKCPSPVQQPRYHHQHRPPFSAPHQHPQHPQYPRHLLHPQQQHQHQPPQQRQQQQPKHIPEPQPPTTYLNQDSQVVQTLKFFSNDGNCDFSELPKSELEILANANFQYMQQLMLRTQDSGKSSQSSLLFPESQRIGDVTTGSALL